MARGAFKHGKKKNTDAEPGYSASGESQHSREAAHVNIRLGEGKRTDGRLIREQSGALAKLKFKAEIEIDPAKLAKLQKDIAIKTAFVAKLNGRYAEQHDGGISMPNKKINVKPRDPSATWNWTEVENINSGEDYLRPAAEWVTPPNPKRSKPHGKIIRSVP
jgi:hypothetical protein